MCVGFPISKAYPNAAPEKAQRSEAVLAWLTPPVGQGALLQRRGKAAAAAVRNAFHGLILQSSQF